MATRYEVIDAGGREVRISSPDKVLFPEPGITKIELVQYYLAVAEGAMRALQDRPLTLNRFPDGFGGESFYSKRVPKGAPDWLGTVEITFPSGNKATEVKVTEPATLAWAVQMGALELHPWPVRAADADHPDEMRIDLDPQPGTGFAEAVEAAGEARAVLDELGMNGFVKTSGGRGVHLLVRIAPEWTFVEVRRAVIAFARELERRRPDLVTTSWWKEERGERLFVDFNQAARDRTVASAYSTRANAGAQVSMPVRWADLADVHPSDFTPRTVPAIVAERGDALDGIDDKVNRLEPLLEMAERDLRDRGLGDMPYPPEYPKMPGEPKRVQPSRDRDLKKPNGSV